MDFLREGKYADAIKAFKAADKESGGGCAPCLIGLAKAYNGSGDTKNALKSAEAALGSTTDAVLAGVAWNEKGMALVTSAVSEQEKLAEAEGAFRKAVEMTGSEMAQFNDGFALLRLGRDEQGIAALRTYLEKYPRAPRAEAARDLVNNPLRARKHLLPNLRFVTLTGDRFSIDDLRGKVVLVDIWGTWCEPCRRGVPGLRTLAQRMANEPFLLVGIASDPERARLEAFVAENKMSWPQVYDGERALIGRLGISAYPTYLLIAPDGEIVYTASGWSEKDERLLAFRVAQAVKAAAKSARESR